MGSADVGVEHVDGDDYRVTISAGSRRTIHTVTATPTVLARVAGPDETSEDTIRRAFAFLLDRESPSSILRTFALETIATYFPEFWEAMQLRG